MRPSCAVSRAVPGRSPARATSPSPPPSSISTPHPFSLPSRCMFLAPHRLFRRSAYLPSSSTRCFQRTLSTASQSISSSSVRRASSILPGLQAGAPIQTLPHIDQRGSSPNLDDLLLAGERLSRAGRWVDAARLYKKALKEHSSEGAMWAGYGLSLERLGRHTDAVQALEKALALNPKYAPAFLPLARIAVARNRPEEAQRWLERAVYFDTDHGEARIAQAAIAAHLGRTADAESMLRELISNPPNPRLLVPLHAGVQLGQLMTRQRRFSEAMDQFTSVASIARTPPSNAATGSDEAAEAQEKLLIELADVHVQALNGAAGVAQMTGDAVYAVKLYASALEVVKSGHPLCALLHARRAAALLMCGQMDLVEDEATRALSASAANIDTEENTVAAGIAHMSLAQAALRDPSVPSQRIAYAHFARAIEALAKRWPRRSIDASALVLTSYASQVAQCHMLRARAALTLAKAMQADLFAPPSNQEEREILPDDPNALNLLVKELEKEQLTDDTSVAAYVSSAMHDLREAARSGAVPWAKLVPLAHAAALGLLRTNK